jgi:DNA-binding ferritin-like protein
MGVIIKKNTEIPYEYKRTIRTTHDNQERATIKIYEGNYKELEKNHFLGKFTLTNLPRRPAGKVEMELTYKIDSDSILTVTAQEISNPENKKFIQIINTNNTLTNEQVDELREKSEKYIHDFIDENENIISKICNLRNKFNNKLKDEKKKEIIQKIFRHLENLISLIKINENNNQTNYEKYYIYISYLFKEMSIFLTIKAISNEDLEFIKNKIKFYIDSLLNLNDKLELNNLLDLISNFYIVLKNENINNIYIFSLLYIFDIFSKKGQKLFENEKYDESYKILNVIVQQIEIKLIGKNNEITDENILSLYRFAKKFNDYISTIYLRKKKN